MNEKELSGLLKTADEEMTDRISENFPDTDEARKQRIFEKTAEKYAKKLQNRNSSGNFEEINIVRKDTGRVKIKYITAVASFAVVFAGSMTLIHLNNDKNTSQTEYASVTAEITSNAETASSSESCTSEKITEPDQNVVITTVVSYAEASVTEVTAEIRESSNPVSSEKQNEVKPETVPSSDSEPGPILTEAMTEAVTSVSEEYKPEPFYWPVPDFYHVNSGFRDGINHGAIDIDEIGSASGNINGAAVYAASSGIVDACFGTCTHSDIGDRCGGGYGNYVSLLHGDGIYLSIYAHLESITVENGQYVNAGDLIGYAGNTGNSTGPHLHFEVRKNGVKTDPLSYEYIGSPEICTEPVYVGTDEEDTSDD